VSRGASCEWRRHARTQLKAQGPSRTCNESKEEDEHTHERTNARNLERTNTNERTNANTSEHVPAPFVRASAHAPLKASEAYTEQSRERQRETAWEAKLGKKRCIEQREAWAFAGTRMALWPVYRGGMRGGMCRAFRTEGAPSDANVEEWEQENARVVSGGPDRFIHFVG